MEEIMMCAVEWCPLGSHTQSKPGYCRPHNDRRRQHGLDHAAVGEFVPEQLRVRVGKVKALPAAEHWPRTVLRRRANVAEVRAAERERRIVEYTEAREQGRLAIRQSCRWPDPILDRTCEIPQCGHEYRGGSRYCTVHAGRVRTFSLTHEQAVDLLTRKACDACGAPGGKRALHIDHDHACCPEKGRSCGKCVRGILCFACNGFLGTMEKNPERIARLQDYLAGKPARVG